jgi:3alpha(or 20beta)-hydroxysteroid dehydrogenase
MGSDRTVLVTGGARGMGAAHARGFAAQGDEVVIADVLEDEGRALAEEIGGRFVRLDVTREEDWIDAFEALGPLSVLVNNAGILRQGRIERTETAAWQSVLDVNLTGVFLGMKHSTPALRASGAGAIVNVSSAIGFMAAPGAAAYAASKWGVRGLTKVAALELGRDNIRVNSVHPGLVRTEMADAVPDQTATFAIPRMGGPEEITSLVLYLASDAAAYVTGAEFVVDGGMLLGPAMQYRVHETNVGT